MPIALEKSNLIFSRLNFQLSSNDPSFFGSNICSDLLFPTYFSRYVI